MPAIVPPGRVVVGLQLPVQAQSNLFVEPWERTAGPAEILAVARAAESAGFFCAGVCDHVAIPRDLAGRMNTVWYDTVATLAWLAGQTTRIRLLSSVFILAYRHPLVAAKSFMTLDRLSNGRAIVGIGAGHALGEFAALGVDHASRGKQLDRSLEVFERAMRDEWVGEVGLAPRPVQSPRPPIWMGGFTAAAVRRAARSADGWLPQGTPREEMAPMIELFLRERSGAPGDIGATTGWTFIGKPSWDLGRPCSTGSPEEVAAELRTWTALGVNHLQVRFPSRSVGELIEQIKHFGADVLPRIATA